MVIFLFPEQLTSNKWPMWPPCFSCGQFQRAITASRFPMGSTNTFLGTTLLFNSSLCLILFYSLSYRYCSSGCSLCISCTLLSVLDSVSQGSLHKIFCRDVIKYWNTDDCHTVWFSLFPWVLSNSALVMPGLPPRISTLLYSIEVLKLWRNLE